MCLSEVARLTLNDIQLPAHITRDPANIGSVFVKGRGRRERTLYLNYKACRALKVWLADRPLTVTNALFVTKFLEPMRARGIQRVVEKYAKEARIDHASVSTLRHTFGTHHIAKGTDLRTVQEALGHADLKTTSVYLSTAKRAMQRDLQNNAL
jgi:integrase/recombinase XerD